MEIDVCPGSLGLDRGKPDASQYGRIIENHFVETIETSSPRLIEGFRPVTDTGGYDWGGCPFGDFDRLRLVQFKGTLHLDHRMGTETVRFMFNAPHLEPRRNTFVLFGRFDQASGQLADPLWLVPSLRLADVARRHYCAYHRLTHWQFRANVRDGARDLAARYRVDRGDLARRLFPSVRRAPLEGLRLSPLAMEKGGFFEFGFITRFLRDCGGDEKLLKPETDFGRDLLGVALGRFSWASLAVKGTVAVSADRLIHVRVPGRTFRPHRRHFVLVQHFDESRGLLHPVSWLIPSTHFARLAVHGDGDYQMETTLTPSTNRWARYAIPTDEDAAIFMRWMRRPPA